MRKFTTILLALMLLSGCSAARPVIRSSETSAGLTEIQERTDTRSREATAAKQETPRQAPSVTSFIQNPTTNPSKATDLIISASNRSLGSKDTKGSSTGLPNETKPSENTTNAGGTAQTGEEPAKSSDMGKVSEYTLSDYYPLVENRRVDYSEGGDSSSSLILEYYHEDQGESTAQFKQFNDSGSIINVVSITPSEISELYYSQDIPSRRNIMGLEGYVERMILKAPLQVGNQWDSTGLHFEITAVDEPRQIRGKQETVLDVTVTAGDEKIRFSYAVGIGMVSQDVIRTDGSLLNLMTFSGMEEGIPDTYSVNFYFPNGSDGFRSVTRDVDFWTNDATRDILAASYKTVTDETGYPEVLGKDDQILYLFLEGNILHADLNQSFIDSINAHPEMEDLRLQALVDTLTGFFQAEGMILTINDQRYESQTRKIETNEILKPVAPPAQ